MKRLFIIGAMRSGSSSIASYLKQHPDVFDARVKEPNYMIFHNNSENYIRSDGTELARPDHTKNLESYELLYSAATDGQLLLDASSSYISYPNAAKAIAALYPDAYIVATLREPVERAVSAFQFNRKRGTEVRENFLSVLQDEIDGTTKQTFAPWNYIHCGKYQENLQPFFDLFPRDQILLQDFNEFKSDPQKSLQKICDLVGLQDEEFNIGEKVNSSASPNFISRTLNRTLIKHSQKLTIPKRIIRKLFPGVKTTSLLAKLEKIPLKDQQGTDQTFEKETKLLSEQFSNQPMVSEIVEQFQTR